MFCSKSLRLVHIEAIFNARAKARLTVCLLERFRIAGDITFCLLWTVEKFGGASTTQRDHRKIVINFMKFSQLFYLTLLC